MASTTPKRKSAPVSHHKVDFSKLQPGERLSRCVYYKVQKVDPERELVVIENQDGLSFEVTRRIPEQEMYSASQVTKTVKTSRGELVNLLMTAGNTIFTVEFCKQLKPDDVAASLSKDLVQLADMTPQHLKKYSKQLLEGEHRSLVGYLVASEPTLGRSKVVDLDIPTGEPAERLVDHRTLRSIIIRGVKYHV